MRELVLVLAATATLAACSSSDSGPSVPPPPGCDRSTTYGTCLAQAGLTAAECTVGTFRPEGCPQANFVGACIDTQGQTTSYYSPYYEAYISHLFCEMASGTWIGSGAPEVLVSCDDTARSGTCNDMTGPEDEIAVFADACGVNASSTPCPTPGRTGTCRTSSLSITFDTRYYDAVTAGADADACVADGGLWTPN